MFHCFFRKSKNFQQGESLGLGFMLVLWGVAKNTAGGGLKPWKLWEKRAPSTARHWTAINSLVFLRVGAFEAVFLFFVLKS